MDTVCSTLCTGFARFAMRGERAKPAGVPRRVRSGSPIAQLAQISSIPCSASACAREWPAGRPDEISRGEATDVGSTGKPLGRVRDPFRGLLLLG
jgi:hypothetical protein